MSAPDPSLSPYFYHPSHHDTGTEIATTAARWVVEEGLDWAAAKRRAVRDLGLPARTALPSNDQLEEAVAEYLALFCGQTQPAELYALRQLALVWMQRLAAFRPHLSGAVWHGTATRNTDIYLQLFCDDSKSAEIALINERITYQSSTMNGLHGKDVPVLSLCVPCPELRVQVGVHLLVYDADDVRGALRPDKKGRPPRGDIAALSALLQAAA